MAKPKSLVIDVSSAFQPGMAYVMFSRVQSLDQLYIVNSMDPEKITVDDKVIQEAKRMDKVSINRNPCNWMNPNTPGLKVGSFNTRSLRKHIEDIRADPVLMQSDILFVQETWLETWEEELEQYQLEGYRAHFASQGRGKGLAAFVKEGVRRIIGISRFGEPNLQMVKVDMANVEVIGIYRSQEEPLHRLNQILRGFVNPRKDTLIVGDVNICANKPNDLGNYLRKERFRQLVTLPTHICGGIHKAIASLAITLPK